MMSNNSDNFKDFFKDTTSNIVILVSATLFIIFYIILKSADINNASGIIALQLLSLLSMIILIVTIVSKFIPKIETTRTSNFQRMSSSSLSSSWEYIKILFYNLIDFLKTFFIHLLDAIKDIAFSITAPNLYVVGIGFSAILLLIIIGFSLYYFGVDINFEKIKQYGEPKKIIYSIFIFLLFSLVLSSILPKLYSSDISPSYKASLLVSIIVLIAILLGGFFTKEIFSGDYRNYGMLLFNVLIFLAFIYFVYGIKKFFFDPKSPTMETYSTFEYFLYYYLFPILFFIGYILYYIYIYRDEKLSFTDFSDYRVIIFDILTGIVGFYLIYQLVIKNLLSLSTDSPIIHFFKSLIKVIPCIFTALLEYLIKNPSTGFLSVGISAFFIFLIVFASGNVNYTSWYMILLYIIGIIMFIAGLIKVLLSTTSLGETKVFQLLQKTVFALPCLFLLGMDNAFLKQKFGTISEFLFIVLITFFIFFYNAITSTIIPEIYEKYILNDGKQIFNKPISLSKYSFVSSYSNLFNFNDSQSDYNKNNPNKFDYKYGLSFWIYFDSFAPLSNKLYDICCLGDGLKIKYNPVENALYFMYNGVKNINNVTEVKNIIHENEIKEEIEETKEKENFKNLTLEGLNGWNKYKKRQEKLKQFLSKNSRLETFTNANANANVDANVNTKKENPEEIIIHKEYGILLQKWNNIIINYYGGTLDIFINGKIVNSKINVVPYINNTALTVGENNGINGDICNLIYYKSPMSKSNIYRMYHIFKSKNPPVINKSDTNVMNLGETLEIYFSELLEKMNKDEK